MGIEAILRHATLASAPEASFSKLIEANPLRRVTENRVTEGHSPIEGLSRDPAIHRDAKQPSKIYSDIPSVGAKLRLHASPKDAQALRDAKLFNALKDDYFLQTPVPHSLGWPRDFSTAEVLSKFDVENLSHLTAFQAAGFTGRKQGYTGDLDHLIAYLNRAHYTSAIKAAENLPDIVFLRSSVPGHEQYTVEDVLHQFDVRETSDLSNIQDDYLVGVMDVGAGIVQARDQFGDTTQLRQSLEALRIEIGRWAQQIPAALERVGDKETAAIVRRAQAQPNSSSD